jgi:hypothetical protein
VLRLSKFNSLYNMVAVDRVETTSMKYRLERQSDMDLRVMMAVAADGAVNFLHDMVVVGRVETTRSGTK